MFYTYEDVVTVSIKAVDATYSVDFSAEWATGKTWEFDSMSDAVGQETSCKTGTMQVVFRPVKSTMAFPEDAERKLAYYMKVQNARDLWRLLKMSPNFWFALDMANQAELGLRLEEDTDDERKARLESMAD